MKKIILIFSALIIICCAPTKSRNKSITDLNAINADNDYYSKAILDYKLVSKIIGSYGYDSFELPISNPKLDFEYKHINKDSVAGYDFILKNGTLHKNLFSSKDEREQAVLKSMTAFGIKKCKYEIPKKLHDLTNGFQFNHFSFEGSNKIALHAFGISDNVFTQKSKYIVIDYIQYKDFNCPGLPIIRYAVGIRSEFRIESVTDTLEFNKNKSLASLAANVELRNYNVNITVKTIGITGLGSRLNIPSNTTFNVETYNEYQKIINFIKTFKQTESNLSDTLTYSDKNKKAEILLKTKNKDSTLFFEPQVIPVMDEYRTSISQSFDPLYKSIEDLKLKFKEIQKNQKQNPDDNQNPNLKFLDSLKEKMLKDELNNLVEKRKIFIDADKLMHSEERYNKVLGVLENSTFSDSVNPDKKKIRTTIDSINNKYDRAIELESKGFDALLEEQLETAISSFEDCERAYPTFHNAKEISNYLKSVTKKPLNWLEICKKIIKDFSWKMPQKMKNSLNEKVREQNPKQNKSK